MSPLDSPRHGRDRATKGHNGSYEEEVAEVNVPSVEHQKQKSAYEGDGGPWVGRKRC